MFKAYKAKLITGHFFLHLILLVFVVMTLGPFLWMITTSLKLSSNVMRMPPQWLPSPITFEHYVRAFEMHPLAASMVNTLLIAVSVVIGSLFTASRAAFAFSKLRFPYKNKIFGILLTTIMIPGQVSLIPMYVAYSKIGWVDTYWPLMIPHMLTNIYGVFMIRQFMVSVPDAYVEAARIDGAGFERIYFSVCLPLCKPILITQGLFTFIGSWNSFMMPLIVLNTPAKYTVSLLLRLYKDKYHIDWSLLMAASTVSVVPTIILFLIFQRFFVKSVVATGLKG